MDTIEHINVVEAACSALLGHQVFAKAGDYFFTLGEISALAGDFTAAPSDLVTRWKAFKDFLVGNRKKCRRDTYAAGAFSAMESEHVTDGRFMDLSIHNYSHFRLLPGTRTSFNHKDRSFDLPDARTACAYWHAEARGYAAQWRATGTPPDPDHELRHRALLCEGFALHFLVDLFATGHMRVPRIGLFDYFANGLALPPENAHIVAALFSRYAHDVDNVAGLHCTFFRNEHQNYQWRSARFTGDGHQPESDEDARVHLSNTVFSQLVHLDASLALFAAEPAERLKDRSDVRAGVPRDSAAEARQRSPWFVPRYEPTQENFRWFLDSYPPQPTDYATGENEPPKILLEGDGKATPIVLWKGESTVKVLLSDMLTVEVQTRTDPRGAILATSKITLLGKGVKVALTAAGVQKQSLLTQLVPGASAISAGREMHALNSARPITDPEIPKLFRKVAETAKAYGAP